MVLDGTFRVMLYSAEVVVSCWSLLDSKDNFVLLVFLVGRIRISKMPLGEISYEKIWCFGYILSLLWLLGIQIRNRKNEN